MTTYQYTITFVVDRPLTSSQQAYWHELLTNAIRDEFTNIYEIGLELELDIPGVRTVASMLAPADLHSTPRITVSQP